LKRIAVAQVSQETNYFSTVPTTIREFESSGLYHGDEIIEKMAGGKTAIAGALQAVADLGEGRIEIVPILSADAMSGCSIERTVYRRFRDDPQSGRLEADPSPRPGGPTVLAAKLIPATRSKTPAPL
jgi:microcystin degradation protein MlrC